jgi:hypothetical protein
MRMVIICATMLTALVGQSAMAQRMVLDCGEKSYGYSIDTDRKTVTERSNIPGERPPTASYSESEDALVWRWKEYRDVDKREELLLTYTLDTHTLRPHRNYSCRCEDHDWSYDDNCKLLRRQFP